MQVQQIYEIVNSITKEAVGDSVVVEEDLSNVVSVGTTILDNMSVDNYVKKLINHIGKVIFVNRPYSGRAPSVRMDGWEYGSILEKIDSDIPEAEQNPKWQLQDGQTYDQDKFTAPKGVQATFWNDRTTFQVPFSFADDQVKESFSSVTQLNAFFSMIYTKIDTAFTIAEDQLIMQTINNFTANVLSGGNAAQKVNLLSMYNTKFGTTLTAAKAIVEPEFIRFAALQLRLYSRRLTNASKLFNMGKRLRHTPVDLQHIVMLDEFADAADIYLQSDTFHDDMTKLPKAEKVSFWQGSGETYAFEDISSINLIPSSKTPATVAVTQSGILAVIFDHEALGVNNFNKRVTNHYNGLAEFVNNWYKEDAQYFNDFNENFIVFYIADEPAVPETQSLKK